MKTPLISVIIPLYNKEKYIKRTLDSVFDQSLDSFEVIVVDDGSTDKSTNLINTSYNDPRLRLISQRNAGPGSARNHGIALANANFIAFIDADDQWHPDFLKKQYKCLLENPDCGVAISRYAMNDQESLSHNDQILQENAGIFQLSDDTPLDTMVSLLTAMTTGNMLWHKSVIEKYNGFYEHKCMFGEDHFLMISILLNYHIYINDEPLLIYHIQASSLTKKRKTYEDIHTFKPLILNPDFIRKNCPEKLMPLLENYLNHLAFFECCGLINILNIETVRRIRKMYPGMLKYGRKNYFKKYIKIVPKIPLYTLISKLSGK